MKKQLIAFLTLATSAVATPIDLGPPNNRVIGAQTFAWTPDITSLDGQTMSFDLTFANDQFVRIYEITTKVFTAVPYLILHGTGTINNTVGSAYSFDAAGEQNSMIWSFGGGSITANNETFGLSLGGVYPMLVDDSGLPRTDIEALDFYGLHFDITLPDSDNFDIIGGGFLIVPSTNKPWKNIWAIGPHVPDSGSTVALLGLSVGLLIAAKRRIVDAARK